MTSIPRWYTPIVVIALIWNIIGLIAVVINLLLTPEQIASLPAEQQRLLTETPTWSALASIVAVVAGTAGCIGLLIKKRWTVMFFYLSLLGLIVQDVVLFVIIDAVSIVGMTPLIMQSLVLLIAVGLILLARKAQHQGWLN